MPLNPDIRDRAYQFFIEEAQELLQVLETGLLDLRQDHSTSKVHELMRAAHSIKGGAASVELDTIGLLAHRLEDFFKALYSDEVDFDGELESLLLQGYDCLSDPLLAQIEAGTFDEEAALLKAEPVFAALEERLSEALKNADNYIPSSNDLGVDIVASIFEVDVAQALEHLRTVSSNPDDYDPAAELASTLEMFSGFAELFNLPGFSDIVQTAQTALNTNPKNILAILDAAVTDCTLATEQVLEGDRNRGGTVSPLLVELAQGGVQSDSSQAAIDEDSLWSNTSLADDIFGSTPALDVEQIDLERETWTTIAEPSAEDIFGEITSDSISLELAGTDAKVDEITQIFDSLSNQTIEDSLATDINLVQTTAADSEIWSDFAAPSAQAEVEPTSESYVDEMSQIFGLVEIEPADEGETETAETEKNPASADIDAVDSLWSIVDDEVTAEGIFSIVEPTAVEEIEFVPVESGSTTVESSNEDEHRTFSTSDNSASIAAAVESVTDIFENLTVAQPDSLLPPPKKSPPALPQPEAKSAQKTAAKLSVRVDLDRLERMNNLVGELTINRNSLGLQNEQLQSKVSELERKFGRFRSVAKQLQEVSDRMLLEARNRHFPNSAVNLASVSKEMTVEKETRAADNSAIADFDALELDSYNQLYSSLQEIIEEMVQLEESVEDIAIFAGQSDRTIDSQRQMLGQMRDELMWVRMLPLDRILQRFPRTLRDLSSKHHKPVDLKLQGTGVLVDKAVLEKLADPLLHLLRNGFDHGIETPEIRTQQGKPPTGSIEIRAYYQGNQTVIEVKDDGQGLDVERIKQKGIERGLIKAQEANYATPEQLFELIFEPGFSTASQVSELSGRGVGMNIVRSQVETLKGKISVTSTPGLGSTFTLRLPLTLTIAKLLVCSLGATAFAIPSDSIEELIIPLPEQVESIDERNFLTHNGRLVPIYSLQKLLAYNCPVPNYDSSSNAFKTIAPPDDWAAPLLLLRRGQQLFALEVVSLLSEQELVIKPYGKAIAAPTYSYGCTILSDGSLIPAFDGSALIGMILGEKQHPAATSGYSDRESLPSAVNTDGFSGNIIPKQEAKALKTIMIVDDSTALRRTMALTLEREGYLVVQKKDGKDALNGFRQNPELDLIICDVEMPVMNGFEFLGMRRRDSALAQIPTFMLTSRSGAKHRNLAQQLGANGYFTKPYVEQDFIQEVKQILNSSRPQNKTNTIEAIQRASHDLANGLDGLPRKGHRGEVSPSAAMVQNAVREEIAIETKTILVIDDSSALRRTLALTLEQKGYRVLQGRDGNEGLEQLRNNLQTDLVICDVEMPNVNGFEFLTLRRDEPQLREIPTIMLTSRGSEKHRNLAVSLGAVGFFTKPYVEDKFISEIEQYIR